MVFRNELFKTRRTLLGLTVRDLAKKLNVAASQISRWENGKSTPFPKQIKAILKVLNLKPGDLFVFNGKEKVSKSKEGADDVKTVSNTAS